LPVALEKGAVVKQVEIPLGNLGENMPFNYYD